MVELLLKETLFQGEDDYDQYLEILRIVGFPEDSFKVKKDLSEPRYSICDEVPLAGVVLSEEGFDLLTQLLSFDPWKKNHSRMCPQSYLV